MVKNQNKEWCRALKPSAWTKVMLHKPRPQLTIIYPTESFLELMKHELPDLLELSVCSCTPLHAFVLPEVLAVFRGKSESNIKVKLPLTRLMHIAKYKPHVEMHARQGRVSNRAHHTHTQHSFDARTFRNVNFLVMKKT